VSQRAGTPAINDREPTPARQAELRAAYEANVAAGKSPYDGVAMRALGEVLWIMRERDWVGEPLPARARTNLSGADLRGVNLAGANLHRASFKGSLLGGTDLSGADLRRADLEGAYLRRCNLQGARLAGANLDGADMREIDIGGADLRLASLGSQTLLRDVKLTETTCLGEVAVNAAILSRIDWDQARRLGDEVAIKEAKGRRARIRASRDAARAYRGLSLALRAQGLLVPAARYRLREQVLERKASFWEGKFPAGPSRGFSIWWPGTVSDPGER